MGSLFTAVASFLDIRAHGGQWLLRIDDLDRERTSKAAEAAILRTLEAHGLHWDRLVRQSDRCESYASAVETLQSQGLVYRCQCTRKQLRGQAIYPGTCRALKLTHPATTVRVRCPSETLTFVDLLQGTIRCDLARDVGDFVVVRRDGTFGYPLTNIVDEAALGITRVVRGSDLLGNTPAQLFLGQRLQLPIPEFAHLPVIIDRRGAKISKQTFARPVEDSAARQNLFVALELLGLTPPGNYRHWTVPALLVWAREQIDPYAFLSALEGKRELVHWISV